MRSNTVARVLHLITALALMVHSAGASSGVPPLVEAVKRGDGRAARLLLDQRVDVNAPEPDGATALQWAVYGDDLETTDLLIRAGAKVATANRYGITPLALACTNGNAAIVERLLEAGADPNSTSADGETVLMTAARAGSLAVVTRLMARGADVNARESYRGQTALMWAVAQDHPAVAKALLDHSADVHARSTGGFAPMIFAVRSGSRASVEVLLAAGARVDETAPDGSTSLIVAIMNAHYELAALLLDRGANPNAGGLGWTPLHAAVRARNPDTVAMPNPIPTGSMGSLDLVSALLAHGADPNARATKALPGVFTFLNLTGATPFLLAAQAVDVPLMRLLVAHGADPLLATADGTTPLMVAAGIGYDEGRQTAWSEAASLEAVKFAVSLGGTVNAVDQAGNTALHGAALTGANTVVSFLVDQGARLDATNRQGWTPLTIADGIHLGALFKVRPQTAVLLRELAAK
jgi:ankyrin repeat protein